MLVIGVSAVLLLVASQVVLPRVAVQRVREKIKPYGSLDSVSVHAWPALELLWGKADAVNATAHSLALDESQAMKLAWEGRGVNEARVAVDRVALQVPGLPAGVVLQDMVSHKQGDRISTQATITQAGLNAASPSNFRIQPLASEPGTVKVRASGSLFGLHASVEALAVAREGKLVAHPVGIPFGGFIQLTLFSDPHVSLDGVSLVQLTGARQASWRLALNAHLH